MLLTVSETLTSAWDFIVQHCAELGITISIPILVGIIGKIIFSIVKNKITIKTSTLSLINGVKKEILELKNVVAELKSQTQENLVEIRDGINEKIDAKFDELKQKRIKLYNDMMSGVDKIEETTTQVIETVEQEIEKVEEVVENIEVEQPVEKPIQQNEVSIDDLMR